MYVGNPKEIKSEQMLEQVEKNKVPIIIPMGKGKR